MSANTFIPRCPVNQLLSADTGSVLYTCPADKRMMFKSITLYNTHASTPATFTLSKRKAGGTAFAFRKITMTAGDTWIETPVDTFEPNDELLGGADVADIVTIQANGVEIPAV